MNSFRQQTVNVVNHRTVRKFNMDKTNGTGEPETIRSVFGKNKFGISELKEALSPMDYESLMNTLTSGQPISEETSRSIADVVKTWALKKGVTHYCHWFQPQTGQTAEKHDSILTLDKEGLPIEEFSYSQLIQSEPDASSFPSGGMRSTFEARGYTAWDPTSPMFIAETENGSTLCIPSVFISYTGEALDKKTPLLRSMKAIDVATRDLLTALEQNEHVSAVVPTVGPEQEYFLVDKAFYTERPDLVLCGRVFGGQPSTRGQTLEDHYFGNIPSRVQAFMQEVEYELYKIGVVAKTRHNEVAPSQFELAVLFQDANVAADHNQMVMANMAKVAERHNFKLLLHEKPYAGINGSGKHVNWSLRTNTGTNLLNPGENKEENLRFLCILGAILQGVYQYGGLIRASIGSLGNDMRLGGNEAPPAIVSVFLGETIRSLFDQIRKKNFSVASKTQEFIKIGLKNIPDVPKDNTDRNRTSPFAFTGNKFEYRAVGGSASISWPVTVINTVVAEGMTQFTELLESKKKRGNNLETAIDLETAIFQTLHDTLVKAEDIVFEGNNYSEDWIKEATRRGLPILPSCAEAYAQFWEKKTEELFTKHHVLSHRELMSRATVLFERYIKSFEIECRTLINMVKQHVVPAAQRQLTLFGRTLASQKSMGLNTKTTLKLSKTLSSKLDSVVGCMDQLETKLTTHKNHDDLVKTLSYMRKECFPLQQKIEALIGDIESDVADVLWTLPKVYEMLHLR